MVVLISKTRVKTISSPNTLSKLNKFLKDFRNFCAIESKKLRECTKIVFGNLLVCPDGNRNTKLSGIVSFGQNGCTSSGVYTRVSHYEDWITERIVA